MNYKTIETDRAFKDTTGYNRSQFDHLLIDYEQTYIELHKQSYEEYIEEFVTEDVKLPTLGDALFFVLFQLKNDMIMGSLGVVFGMGRSTAIDNFEKFLKLLNQTLEKKR